MKRRRGLSIRGKDDIIARVKTKLGAWITFGEAREIFATGEGVNGGPAMWRTRMQAWAERNGLVHSHTADPAGSGVWGWAFHPKLASPTATEAQGDPITAALATPRDAVKQAEVVSEATSLIEDLVENAPDGEYEIEVAPQPALTAGHAEVMKAQLDRVYDRVLKSYPPTFAFVDLDSALALLLDELDAARVKLVSLGAEAEAAG